MSKAVLLIVMCVLLVGIPDVGGQTSNNEGMTEAKLNAMLKQRRRDVLKGLQGVKAFAVWKNLNDSDENNRLQSAVELRLRTNGVHVFATDDEYEKSRGQPILICSVTYVQFGSVIVERTDVNLHEELRSIRTSTVHSLATWENTIPSLRQVEAASFEQARERMLEAVDEFCNDYRAANSKAMPVAPSGP